MKIEETLEEWLKNIHSNKPHFGSIGASSKAIELQVKNDDLTEHLLPVTVEVE